MNMIGLILTLCLTLCSISHAASVKNSALPQVASGLIFYADYTDGVNGVNADYATGSPVGTFTRSAGNCTYVGSAGVVTTVSAADAGRFDGGYWDATGFHATSGLRIEAAAKNRMDYSETPENAAWTKTNITADNDDAGSASPNGVATANSLTATNANATFTQGDVDAVAGQFTASVWIKRKTGTGDINLRAHTSDSYTSLAITSSWGRYTVTSTSQTNATFDLQIVTSGDAIYVYGMQLEKNSLATSYVPSATTDVTRNSEVLSYVAASNIVDVGTIVIKAVPNFTDTTKGNQNNYIFSCTADSRAMVSGYATDVKFSPNATDSVNCLAPVSGLSVFSAYTPVTIACTAQHASPYAGFYKNGWLLATPDTSDDYTTLAPGANMYVGVNNDSTSQFSGLISKIAIYNRVLTETEIATLNNVF